MILISSCGIGSAYKETQLSTNKADQWNPSLWRDYIVWQDARNGGSDIYLTDMAKKVQTRVTKGVDAQNPCVAGTKIVWSDDRNGNSDIYMYDITTKKTTRITFDKANQMNPETYDKYIVWDEEDKQGSNIYVYDLSSKKKIQLTKSGIASHPSIYGNKVVWSESFFDEEVHVFYNDLNMYDLSTKKTINIFASGPLVEADIYNTKVLWTEAMSNLCIYDIKTEKTTTIDLKVEFPTSPSMYSNKVVWSDYRNGNSDIYMAQF